MPAIPRAIEADQVRQLLASIDRRTAIGRRDYAIVLLLARLGLRSGEVAFLELDDIDWNVGRLSVRGKNGRSEHGGNDHGTRMDRAALESVVVIFAMRSRAVA